MTLEPWFYIAGGVIVMLAAPRLGEMVYQWKRWPNPIHRQRELPEAAATPEYRRGVRKRQAVFLLTGAGLLIAGVLKIISGGG